MTNYLGVCCVRGGLERQAQKEIERAGFGTRLPIFRVALSRQGDRHISLRPLYPGYVFAYLQAGYGDLDEIEGVRVLKSDGQPIQIRGRDEERLAEVERDCLLGEFNRIQYRNAAGRFGTAAVSSKPRQKKRRQRSVTAKADRRRKRRAKSRGVGIYTDATNQVAA